MTCAMINENHGFYKYDGGWQEISSQEPYCFQFKINFVTKEIS